MGVVSIQIIEGNQHLRSLLSWHLQQANYQVFQSVDCGQAKDLFLARQPRLVILSNDLPNGGGIEFCQWMQQQGQGLLMMLSAQSTESEIVKGLRSGADDYLTKPFGMQEFLARVEALTRRLRNSTPPAALDYGTLKIDLVHRRIRFFNQQIELTPQEFSLLYVLAQANGAPLSRSELLRRAWPDEIDNPRTVDTHVLSLRKKVETDSHQPGLIQTVRNVGYRLNIEGLTTPRPPTEGLTGNGLNPTHHLGTVSMTEVGAGSLTSQPIL